MITPKILAQVVGLQDFMLKMINCLLYSINITKKAQSKVNSK